MEHDNGSEVAAPSTAASTDDHGPATNPDPLAALLGPARTLAALGVPIAMVQDIVMRQALFDGRTSTVELCDKLHVGPSVMTMIIEELRNLRYLEVQGLESRNYKLALTESGREQTNDRLQMCRYAGAVPVGLEVYREVVRLQHAAPQIDMATLRASFSDLVVSDDLLEELGPATLAGGAMFLYGPPGTGKSSIAERLLRVHKDAVAIPYAVEVDGQVITVFDPIQHRPLAVQPETLDRRWVMCARPSIIVGGELTARMLDLAYEPGTGIYLAPLQMQANNGILVIDDFGRQVLTPEQLLNRWIVPLDRQIDYLSLNYGVKFEVPFDPKIVFSTNLEPEVLGDEAFFRRIQSKILIPTIEDDQFDEVLRRVCIAKAVPIAPGAAEYVRHVSRTFGDGDLRPYLPAAMVKILLSMSEFRGSAPVFDRETIDRVARVYFTHARKLNPGCAAAAPAAPVPASPASIPRVAELAPTPVAAELAPTPVAAELAPTPVAAEIAPNPVAAELAPSAPRPGPVCGADEPRLTKGGWLLPPAPGPAPADAPRRAPQELVSSSLESF